MRGISQLWKNLEELNAEAILRTADENELPALLELWTAVLNPDVSVFTSMYASVPGVKRTTFVVECDGKIVSSVQLFILPIRDELCKAVPVGAIANVSTLPEYRSRGFAKKLLAMAYDDMKAAGCAWSFLFTGIMPFYEKLGWRQIHRTFLGVNIGTKADTDSHSDVILQDPPDLERLHMLSESSFVSALTQIRGDLDWKHKIPPRMGGKLVFMGEDSFAIVQTGGGKVTIEEWGMPEPSVIKFRYLIDAVAHWAVENDIHRLIVSAPIVAEARQVLETCFSHVDEIDVADAMVRPVSGKWPMTRLVSLFSLPEARFLGLDSF